MAETETPAEVGLEARLAATMEALRREIGPPTNRDHMWQPMVSAGEVRMLLDHIASEPQRVAAEVERAAAPLSEGEVTQLLNVWRAAGPNEVSPIATIAAVNLILDHRVVREGGA